eukprot:SAG22_NODE_195_length_15606_cov_21.340878_10_plen_80_part_00
MSVNVVEFLKLINLFVFCFCFPRLSLEIGWGAEVLHSLLLDCADPYSICEDCADPYSICEDCADPYTICEAVSSYFRLV